MSKVRIYVQRTVGHTSVSLECPPDQRVEVVKSALEILQTMPESTFQGDGVAITSIPMGGPGMDGPMGFSRKVPPSE